MKVNFINIQRGNYKPLNGSRSEKAPMAYDSSFKASGDYVPSFGMSNVPKNVVLTTLKSSKNLPCMYCGKNMIPNHIFESINWFAEPQMRFSDSFLASLRINHNQYKFKIKNTPLAEIFSKLTNEDRNALEYLIYESQKVSCIPMEQIIKTCPYEISENIKKLIYKKGTPSEYSKKTIHFLKKYEGCMLPVEKTVFNEIRAYHSENPEAGLREIMQGLRPKHLQILVPVQTGILNKIADLAKKLPKETRQRVIETTMEAKGNLYTSFKRKDFIASIRVVLTDVKQTYTARKIIKKAKEIPNSSHPKYGASAFIVKYSEEVPVKIKIKSKEEVPEETKKLEDILVNSEKLVLEAIKDKYGKIYPDKSIQEIMEITYSEHLKNVTQDLRTRIKQVNINAQNFSTTLKDECLNITNDERKMLTKSPTDGAVLRKKLFDKFKNLKDFFNEQQYDNISKAIIMIPRSTENMNAFIVKYWDLLNNPDFRLNAYWNNKWYNKFSPQEKNVFYSVSEYFRPKSEYTLMDLYVHDIEAYSHKTIVTLDDADKIVQNMTKAEKTILSTAKKVSCPNDDVYTFLDKHWDKLSKEQTASDICDWAKNLTPQDKAAFKIIKKSLNRCKNAYLRPRSEKTLQEAYPEIVESLRKNQIDALDEIDNITQSIFNNIEKNFLNIIKGFADADINELKSIIEKLQNTRRNLKSSVSSATLDSLSGIPTSKNNMSTFVVKYADFEKSQIKPDPPPVFVQRSDKEIGLALLKRSITSEEHIKPQTNWPSWDYRKHDMDNIGFAHVGCNSERAHKDLDKTVQDNPQISQNVQKNVDSIIKRTVKDATDVYYNYVNGIKRTLKEESNGLIDVDTSLIAGK